MTPEKPAIHAFETDDAGQHTTAAAPSRATQSGTETEIGFLKSVFAEISGTAPQRPRHSARETPTGPQSPSPQRPAGGSGTKVV